MSDGVFWPEFEAWLHAHGIEVDDCSEVRVTWTPRSVHSEQQRYLKHVEGRSSGLDG